MAGKRTAGVTPGQEKLIVAAFDAGVIPAAIAREFRIPRATVRDIVAETLRK